MVPAEVAMMRNRFASGPWLVFLAWAVHDIEEALTFPQECNRLAERTGLGWLRMNARQSWCAVGLMGVLVGAACLRGGRRGGQSRLYRLTVAGFEAHVATHVAASFLQRGYTPGVATALPVVWPAARLAKRDLARHGWPLEPGDYARGAAILPPAAVGSHALARTVGLRRRRA
ncbi:MAG TPA: HXXEE domain-containing protein [Ruania sp.]|nr:HXXEE domain-containing protein [Ruania sp.]